MMKFLLTVFLLLQFGEVFATTQRPVLGEFEGKVVGFLLQGAGEEELEPLEKFVRRSVFLGKSMAESVAKFSPILKAVRQLPQGKTLMTTLQQANKTIVFCDVSAPMALGMLGQALNSPANKKGLPTALVEHYQLLQGKEWEICTESPEARDAVYFDYSKQRYFLSFCFKPELDLVVTGVEQVSAPTPHLKVSFALVEKDMVERLFHELNHIGNECILAMNIRIIDGYMRKFEKQVKRQPKDRFTCRHMMKFFPNPKELDPLEDLFEDDGEFVCMTGFFANGEHLFWTPVCEWEVQQTSKGYFRAMHNEIDLLQEHLARVKKLGAGIFEGTDDAFSISFRPDCHDGLVDHLRPLVKLWQCFLECHERYHQTIAPEGL